MTANTSAVAARELAEQQAFDAEWERTIAENSGHQIGADYRHWHWMWQGWKARAAQPAAPAVLADYTPGKWFMANSVDEMRAFFLSRLPAIREAAQGCGYAIGLHGSERRDFDLIAVPWRDACDSPDALARALAIAACGLTRQGAYEWERKPMGRIAVSIPICWCERWADNMDGAGHIDLSVIGAPLPALNKLICPQCGVDRFEVGCPQTPCAMIAEAHGIGSATTEAKSHE